MYVRSLRLRSEKQPGPTGRSVRNVRCLEQVRTMRHGFMATATLAVLQDLHLGKTCSSKTMDLLAALRLPSHPRRDEVWVRLADLFSSTVTVQTFSGRRNYHRLIRDDTEPRNRRPRGSGVRRSSPPKAIGPRLKSSFGKSTKLATGAQALCATYRQACALERLGHVRLSRKALPLVCVGKWTSTIFCLPR